MPKKKIEKRQKNISKTKRVAAPKPSPKPSKKKTAGASAKKVQTVKKVVKKTAKKVKAEAPAAKTTKKLSPREKLMQGIKKRLAEQKNILLSEAEEALNILPGQTIFPDMGDQASAEIDRSFMLRLRGREQRLLKKIESAIEKIDSGSFGICDVCGEEIDIKRLEARPVTNMCIFCKKEQEEEEKLRGE